jgi:hypothetical protein
MNITLTENTGADTDRIPYYARIEIQTVTVDAGATFEVPVYVNSVGLNKVYNLEMCGFRLETAHLGDLPQGAARLLNGLINMARLPSYVFIARRAGGIYPVYTVNNEVIAVTPGGPVFRHVELAKVRTYLTDYLHQVKVLGEGGLSDKLHVRGVDMHTLGLRRPIFYLKKRVPGQTEFWAPVFESGNGRFIYTYAVNARRQVPIADGREVLNLRALVAELLGKDGRLPDPYDLRIGRLFPDRWQQLRRQLEADGDLAANGKMLALFRDGETLIGLESRPKEERYSLFLGRDADDLRRRARLDFNRRGVHKAPVAVVESVTS